MADPRSCLFDFSGTGRNFGSRPPSLSLRDVNRDVRATKTQIGNIGTRVEGAIGAASRGEFLPGQLLSVGNELRCPPTAYAAYFSERRPPKFKFMFFASLELHESFVTAFGGSKWSEGEVWWFIKQSQRPNVTYDYEEVNMYNFRQKVLRRATLEPVTLQLYDDMQDASHSFWNTFIRIQNPVTSPNLERLLLEENGMNWVKNRNGDIIVDNQNLNQIRSANGEIEPVAPTEPNPAYQPNTLPTEEFLQLSREEQAAHLNTLGEPERIETGDPAPIHSLTNSSSTGVLPAEFSINPPKQIIKSIKLHHIIDWGQKVVVYDFIHPRINEIRLDELTWESSDPAVIDITFEYDTFNILFPVGVGESTVAEPAIPPAYGIQVNSDQIPLPFGLGKFTNIF